MKSRSRSTRSRQRNADLAVLDDKTSSSSNSDPDLEPIKRRSSSRLQTKMLLTSPEQSKKASTSKSMGDSAYDADGESGTAESSPEKSSSLDPYEIDMIEDIPVVSKKKKKTQKTTRQGKVQKNVKKGKQQVPVPTSTPVLTIGNKHLGKKHKGKMNCSEHTPEVTPILPVDSGSSSNITPQIRKSMRKRKKCSSPDTPTLPSPILDPSQGDSGIVMSPTPKRSSTGRDSLSGLQISTKITKMKNKGAPCWELEDKDSENCGLLSSQGPRPKKQRKPLSKNTSVNLNSESVSASTNPQDDSCFGFSSINSPFSPYSNPSSLTKPPKTGKNSGLQNYRSSALPMSDSSGEISKQDRITESDFSQRDSQGMRVPSPSLFSDSFSTTDDPDSLELNRTSTKMYKMAKAESNKQKENKSKQASKLEEWASNFNMEIEELEKFDLVIE